MACERLGTYVRMTCDLGVDRGPVTVCCSMIKAVHPVEPNWIFFLYCGVTVALYYCITLCDL